MKFITSAQLMYHESMKNSIEILFLWQQDRVIFNCDLNIAYNINEGCIIRERLKSFPEMAAESTKTNLCEDSLPKKLL